MIDYFKFGSAFIDIKRKFMFNVFWKDVFDNYKVLQDKIIPNTGFGFYKLLYGLMIVERSGAHVYFTEDG